MITNENIDEMYYYPCLIKVINNFLCFNVFYFIYK